MLFYSKFYALPFFIFEILRSCRDARKLSRVEVGNFKLLLLLRADTYLDNTTDHFYCFRNMQETLCCNYVIFSHQLTFLSLKFSGLINISLNTHVPTDKLLLCTNHDQNFDDEIDYKWFMNLFLISYTIWTKGIFSTTISHLNP